MARQAVCVCLQIRTGHFAVQDRLVVAGALATPSRPQRVCLEHARSHAADGVTANGAGVLQRSVRTAVVPERSRPRLSLTICGSFDADVAAGPDTDDPPMGEPSVKRAWWAGLVTCCGPPGWGVRTVLAFPRRCRFRAAARPWVKLSAPAAWGARQGAGEDERA